MRKFLLAAVFTSACLGATNVSAAPIGVVFMPSADTRKLGQVGGYVDGYFTTHPATDQGTWFGIEVGVMPWIKVAKDVEIGGLDVGIDAFGPSSGPLKPVLNAKLTLIHQVGWVPSIATGLMQLAIAHPSDSVNLAYLVATEAVLVGPSKTNLGSVTLGIERSFAPTKPEGEEPLFHGTAPFSYDSRNALMLGYQSPSLGMFSVAGEYRGGYSENSYVTGGVYFTPTEWFYACAGVWLTSDRSTKYREEGLFTFVGFEWETLKAKEAKEAKEEK